MRLHCYTCGKSVSTEVPEGTIIRAAIECPECLEKQPDYKRQLDDLWAFVDDLAAHDPDNAGDRALELKKKWKK